MLSLTSCNLSTVTNINYETETKYYSEPGHCTSIVLAVVGPFSALHSKPCLSSQVNVTPLFIVKGAVGHFSLTTFSIYTALSTLFAGLGMWAVCAAWQCVCVLASTDIQGSPEYVHQSIYLFYF